MHGSFDVLPNVLFSQLFIKMLDKDFNRPAKHYKVLKLLSYSLLICALNLYFA